MTPLDRSPLLLATAIILIATVGLSGCLSGLGGEDADQGAQLFLGASSDEDHDATASLAAASLSADGGAEAVALDVRDAEHDLSQLSADGTVALAATGPATTLNATKVTLTFNAFTIDDTDLSGQSLEVPVTFPADPEVDVTVTLDLDQSLEDEAPVLDQLVVERGDTILESVTASELEERDPPPEIPPPTIVATADGGNVTGPSFLVNEQVNVTYQLPTDTEATVENVFWSFGDGSTATGPEASNAYRAPGFYQVTVVVEGERGQQATGRTVVDAYLVEEGEGSVGAGTGGEGAVDRRDVQTHSVDMPENFTSVSIQLREGPSADYCSEDEQIQDNDTGVNETVPGADECAPSNLHVEWYDPDGTLIGENTTDADRKWINVTGLMASGEWTLQVKGDQGANVGYTFEVETHYLGLCQESGGLDGYACPDEPAAVESSDDGLVP